MSSKINNQPVKLLVLIMVLIGSCNRSSSDAFPPLEQPIPVPTEIEVQEIALGGSAAQRRAEISGMAWYGNTLILLPQFPSRFGSENTGAVLAIERSTILDHIENPKLSPIEPEEIPFDDGGVSNMIPKFEGFEAIAIHGDQVFLTIEASPKKMKGYLIVGTIQPNASGIILDPASLTDIPLQASLKNFSDEAIVLFGSHILTIYEANGKIVNPSPVAHLFNLSGELKSTLPYPNIEYRITDAAPPGENGYFWAINTYFPADEWKLKPQEDALVEDYGVGKTHLENLTVERLVLFQITDTEIKLADQPPVQLQLAGDVAPRNWEALALLGREGFLIATDKFPRTILGFVPFELEP